MNTDLMLQWMSETGGGSARDLRDKVAWFARTYDVRTTHAAPGRWLRDLSALAHAEVDWSSDRWSIAPAVITRLPASDATAVFVGSRRSQVVDRLEGTDLSILRHQPEPAQGDLPAPSSIFVQYDDVDGLRSAAAAVGARYVGCAALKLAARLLPLRLGAPAAPPAHANRTLERLTERDGGITFAPSAPNTDGLYRFKIHGRTTHLYLSKGQWRHCDLAVGVFTDYARRGLTAMRWRAERDSNLGHVGTLFVDWGAPLPALHTRALTLCSGIPPRFSAVARTAIYGNVPHQVAAAVAGSLSQILSNA